MSQFLLAIDVSFSTGFFVNREFPRQYQHLLTVSVKLPVASGSQQFFLTSAARFQYRSIENFSRHVPAERVRAQKSLAKDRASNGNASGTIFTRNRERGKKEKLGNRAQDESSRRAVAMCERYKESRITAISG